MKIIKLLIILFFVLDIFLIYKVTLARRGLFDYLKLENIREEYLKKIDNIHRENLEMSKKIQLIKENREFQEKVIRKKLHFGKKNEFLYITPKK